MVQTELAAKTDSTKTFDNSHSTLAFPLGGIGTGNISLGARGELRDWEIFNVSAKGVNNPNSFFAIRVQAPGGEPMTRVLEGQLAPPHSLSHGYHPHMNGGLPRFKHSTFTGEYPLANVVLQDPYIPVQVELEAFNPLIPLNADDSGLPLISLTYKVTNLTDQPLEITLVGSVCNPIGGLQLDPFDNIAASKVGKTRNEFRQAGNLRGIFMTVEGVEPGELGYGSMSLVTTHENVTAKPYWLRSGWWDYLQEFWDDLNDDGKLNDLGYTDASPRGIPDTASLGVIDTLQPGETRSYPFWLTWHIPNRTETWQTHHQIANVLSHSETAKIGNRNVVQNHYAVQFADAWAVAQYAVSEWARLDDETRKFHDAMFESTLPSYVIDAISANIVPVRSNTCFWLADGRFYGWEGCFDDDGCCAGSCTHVWAYAYTAAFLFPSLEREMRRLDFNVETEPDGFMNFRNFKSMGEPQLWLWQGDRPQAASDGQMGMVLHAYREYLLSGDKAWLASLWDGIKRALDYATSQWDTDLDGVLDGKQHNTYDIEFYGPNPLSGIYYLAALRAAEEMAKVLGEMALAERLRGVFEKGSAKLDSLLWNGEFFIQKLDDVDAFRYQHGLGCLADQLLGQMHAHALGLGDLLPHDHVSKAIKSVFDYDFRENFDQHTNAQRTYVLNDEAGLVMCSWPNGGRPKFPFPYSDEVWTGIEYQVAAELIYNGWTDEGLRIVKAVQDRHDGIRRNRWDEVECGHHYARSMASWAVLLALSGQQGDVAAGMLTFKPVLEASTNPNLFQCFWSNGKAWGVYRQRRESAEGAWTPEFEVLGGSLGSVQVS